jgi:putative acetyltransferase
MHATTRYQIEVPESKDYPHILSVWEAAVRATHYFLAEEDIRIFKQLIQHKYLDEVQLYCIWIEQMIAGFTGTSADKIEMLFVHPAFHSRGIGKQLLLYAVYALNKKLVDVNEQNQKAVNFYLHFGFVVISRSEKDNMGKSYPLLHMQRAP